MKLGVIPSLSLLSALVSVVVSVAALSALRKDLGASHVAGQIAELNKISNDLKNIYSPSDLIIQKLDGFERSVTDQIESSSTLQETEKLRSELKAFIDGLSPLIQDALLPRLIPLRWSVQSLSTVRSFNDGDESKAALVVEGLDAALEVRPEGVPTKIVDLIVTTRRKAEQKAIEYRRATAIESARKSLLDYNAEDMSASWSSLDSLENKDDTVIGLQREVREKLLGQEIRSRSDELQRQLKSLGSVTDEILRQSGLAKVYETATAYKLALIFDMTKAGVPMLELDRVIDESGRAIKDGIEKRQSSDAEKVREYQKWALEEIQRFQKIYSEVESKVNDQGIGKRDWRDEHYKLVRNAMVANLAPISINFLDPAVAQLYQKAFQRGWDRLDGRDEQLYVAQQSGIQVKKTPDSCRK